MGEVSRSAAAWLASSTAAILVVASMVGAAATGARDTSESVEVFLRSWRRAAEYPDDAAGQWFAFASAHQNHDLGRIAALLNGIALLRDAKPANQVLNAVARPQPPATEQDAEASIVPGLVRRAAQGLRARAAMQALAVKLQAHYRKHVEYPPSLAALVAAGFAAESDIVDPFGDPFPYAAMPRRLLPELPRQTFQLRCRKINAEHRTFRSALTRSAQPMKDMLLSSVRPDLGQAYVKRIRRDGTPGPSLRWQVGKRLKNLTLWLVTERYIVVAWEQFPFIIEMAN